MAAAAKSLFSDLRHGTSGSVRNSLHRTTSNKIDETSESFQRNKEQEKHFIASWESGSQKSPLPPNEVAKDPAQKQVGHSSKHLRCEDFKLIKTLGTGTFARVWLAKLAKPQAGDEDKVFALKILRKVDIIKLKQIEHVKNERDVLAAVAGHPFITTMVASFQDADSLYMILDYCPGGEVFTYLRRSRRFDERTARFYAAEIALIFEFLHEKEGVAYRDLKPENILLDAQGHIKLVDFGFAKKVEGRQTWTLCGTPEYLAPETIKNTGHNCGVDWWAFGILIFEFLVGQPPFWDQNPMKIYEQIVEGKIKYPSAMSADAKDIVSKLCEVDATKRLGNLQRRSKDVKEHVWFKSIEWEKLYKRELEAPIKPHLSSATDTRNFEEYDDEPKRRVQYTDDMKKKYDSCFSNF